MGVTQQVHITYANAEPKRYTSKYCFFDHTPRPETPYLLPCPACVLISLILVCSCVRRGVAMVFAGIGYEMRGKYQRHNAKKIKG